jgi:hypothetical protein
VGTAAARNRRWTMPPPSCSILVSAVILFSGYWLKNPGRIDVEAAIWPKVWRNVLSDVVFLK